MNKNRKDKINQLQFKIYLRLLDGKFKMNLQKQNFLFKCIVFEMESRYFKGGISFQNVLDLIAYRYVDCKRFLEPDEFIEREGNLRDHSIVTEFQWHIRIMPFEREPLGSLEHLPANN